MARDVGQRTRAPRAVRSRAQRRRACRLAPADLPHTLCRPRDPRPTGRAAPTARRRCGVPRPRHWQIFSELCATAGTRGNLIPDAFLAALAIEQGATWVTLDRDFARFPGLRWTLPGT
ncbi:MAG: PIN domain-containing protein [Actinomycetes bacterium]